MAVTTPHCAPEVRAWLAAREDLRKARASKAGEASGTKHAAVRAAEATVATLEAQLSDWLEAVALEELARHGEAPPA